MQSKKVRALKNLKKCGYMPGRKTAVCKSCTVKPQLLQAERPLSGAAAHNFHLQQASTPRTQSAAGQSTGSLRVGLQ